MSDKLVFDLSQEVEGTPAVFVRKDWLNILDNQNQNYSNNQSIIDTSQLSNSNKYMSYREAYLSVPLLLSMGTLPMSATTGATVGAVTAASVGQFATAASSADFSMGLKNWFGTIVHSLTLDYNGTTIVQQTPYVNMWNAFKLMTSLSLQDIETQGATIGFYPDDPTAWAQFPAGAGLAAAAAPASGDFAGCGVCNNSNLITSGADTIGQFYNARSYLGNEGFLKRQMLICFDADGSPSQAASSVLSGFTGASAVGPTTSTYGSLLFSGASSLNTLWKSYIVKKQNAVYNSPLGTISTGGNGLLQINVVATIYLKHLHSFFNMAPLLKGVFMKLTLNLNNSSSTVVVVQSAAATGATTTSNFFVSSVTNAIGGVNPLMIAGATANNGAGALVPPAGTVLVATAAGSVVVPYLCNISVGKTCLDQTLANMSGITTGQLSQSIYLYIPSYSFNPVFEQAYLSSPVKQIKYTDIYQYQVLNVPAGNVFNNLITNGIANIKSVLLLPFYSHSAGSAVTNLRTAGTNQAISFNSNTNLPQGMPVWQSPFDPAGTGPTSPLSHITNFNIQVSGQNAIYNLQKYAHEEFNNQLYGQNAVNGGLTDGLTSGLISRESFDMEYCYYYVNVERMLPVEMSVPKSIQVIGQNLSSKAMDYWVFVEYGVEISIDALTGARV